MRIKSLVFFILWGLVLGCSSSGENTEDAPDEASSVSEEEAGFAQPSATLSQEKIQKFEEKQKQKREFFSSGNASATQTDAGPFPVVIKMTQNSAVFSKPSAKSRILADVSSGTTLIARKQTPKGFWLLLEDEEGNKGWVPESRTNLKVLLAKIQSSVSNMANRNGPGNSVESIPDGVPQEIKNLEPEVFSNLDSSSDTEPLSITLLSARIEKIGYGLSFSYLGPMARESKKMDRVQRLGFELGLSRAFNSGASDEIENTAYARMRMLAQNEGQNFGSGPDFGITYKIHENAWGPGVGYSLGYVPAWNSGFLLLIRVGVDWPSWSPLVNIGIETGWVF